MICKLCGAVDKSSNSVCLKCRKNFKKPLEVLEKIEKNKQRHLGRE